MSANSFAAIRPCGFGTSPFRHGFYVLLPNPRYHLGTTRCPRLLGDLLPQQRS
jgi:hypothetical protein